MVQQFCTMQYFDQMTAPDFYWLIETLSSGADAIKANNGN